MKNASRSVVAVGYLVSSLLTPVLSPACTVSCTRNLKKVGPVITHSFDWDNRDGIVMLNDRGIVKTAIGMPLLSLTPHKWQSKYFNVTFNQWGAQMAMGGINEKGLVVMQTKVGDFQKSSSADEDYPDPKHAGGKEALNQLQLVQFLLDKADSLESAVSLARSVIAFPHFRVEGVNPGNPGYGGVAHPHPAVPPKKATYFDFAIDPVHFMVCDAEARCRTLEYREKKLLVSDIHAWEGTPTKDYPRQPFPNGPLPYGADPMAPGPASVRMPLVPVQANDYYETDALCLDAYSSLPQDADCVKDEACRKACGKKFNQKVASTGRFVKAARAADAVKSMPDYKAAVKHAFNSQLKSVCNGDTRWQIVYLPKLKKVYWRTMKDCKPHHKGLGGVDLKKTKATCSNFKPVRTLDLDGSVSGHAYKPIKYGTWEFPTFGSINQQALYKNFSHAARYKKSDAENYWRAVGLTAAQQVSWYCSPL